MKEEDLSDHCVVLSMVEFEKLKTKVAYNKEQGLGNREEALRLEMEISESHVKKHKKN